MIYVAVAMQQNFKSLTLIWRLTGAAKPGKASAIKKYRVINCQAWLIILYPDLLSRLPSLQGQK
jgi:hypothetical protein